MKSVSNFFSFFGKIIPVLVFASSLYGAFQLFNFAKEYNIDFLDLAKLNIIISYGVLFFILAVVVIMLPFSIALWNHYLGRLIYKVLIQEIKYKLKKKLRLRIIIFFYLILSFWPFIFLIKSQNIAFYLFALPPFIMLCYLFFLTKKSKFSFTFNWLYEYLSKIIKSTAIVITPIYIGIITLIFIFDLERRYLNGFSEKWILMTVTVLFFGFSYIPMRMSINKALVKRSSPLYLALFMYFLFILSIQSPFLLSDRVAEVVGLGHSKRCYLEYNLNTLKIPNYYMEKTSVKGVVKLSVVAVVDDIYYLSVPGDEIKKASLKFKASDMKKIACPKS